jgi:phosphatidylinositol glycan class Q protein
VAYLQENNSRGEGPSEEHVDMVPSNGLMRVFWPSDAPRSPNSGVLIGWRNSEYDILVIAILQDVEVSEYAFDDAN